MSDAPSTEFDLDTKLTIPNVMCAVRLVAQPFMLVPAWLGLPWVVLGMYGVFAAMDWVDGRLARALHQRTRFGAKLDTVADVVLYVSLGLSVCVLRPDLIEQEQWWFTAVGVTYAVSVWLSYARFGKWPSYHTRAAKIGWFLVAVATLVVLTTDHRWPVRVAAVLVTLANLEAAAISCVLREPRSDLPSLYHARKLQRTRA